MDRNDARAARLLVVVGFVLMATGAVISATRFVIDGYLFQYGSLSSSGQIILSPLAAVAAAWAWWWMTQITAVGPSQVRAMRRGLYGLSVQHLLTFGLFATIIFSINPSVGAFSYLVQWWAQALGAFAISIGFLTMARALNYQPAVDSAGVDEYPDPGD